MPSTVDTGDIKIRSYETPVVEVLAPDQAVLVDGPASGPGNVTPAKLLAEGFGQTPVSLARPSLAAQVVLEDFGQVHRFSLQDVVGQDNLWYLGPFPVAPQHTSTGGLVQPGNLYFDTTTNQMMTYVSAGQGWQLAGQLLPANAKTYAWYCVEAQQLFPDRTDNPRDVHGQILAFDASSADEVEAFLNGVKLILGADFFLQPDQTVRLAEAATANSVLEVRVLKRVALNYAVGAALVDTRRWVFDGVQVRFPLYDFSGRRLTAAMSTNCLLSVNGLIANPVTDFTVLDGDVIFYLSPQPNDTVWMQVGLPIVGPQFANALEAGGGAVLEAAAGVPLLYSGVAPVLVVDDTTVTQLPTGLVPLENAPTPNSANHGKLCLLSRTGFTDQLLVCVKTLDETYYWQPLLYLAA